MMESICMKNCIKWQIMYQTRVKLCLENTIYSESNILRQPLLRFIIQICVNINKELNEENILE